MHADQIAALAEAEKRAGFKDAEFETVIAEVKRSRDALAAELAEARKVIADVIRWLECGAEAMAKTARPGDSRFGEALAEVVAAIAARDSAGKASGGGGE